MNNTERAAWSSDQKSTALLRFIHAWAGIPYGTTLDFATTKKLMDSACEAFDGIAAAASELMLKTVNEDQSLTSEGRMYFLNGLRLSMHKRLDGVYKLTGGAPPDPDKDGNNTPLN